MTDGIAYYRQSKSDPDGIERQREKVRKMFADMGVNLAGEYTDDDTSATRKKRRPGYEQMMAHLRRLAPGDILGLSKTARLYRKVTELESVIPLIEETGVVVKSVEATLDLSTPNGRMVARMLVAAAQAEVEEKADRQKSANLQDARQGKRNKSGTRPFGWEDDRMTHREAEAQAIRDAVDEILLGASLQSVLRMWWEGRGLRPPLASFGPLPAGNPWSQTTLRNILTNPQNAGMRVYQGEVIGDGDWPAIITPEKQAALIALLSDPGRTMPRGAVSLLGGLAVCTCGNRIKHGTRTNRHRQAGVPYAIYRCDTSTRNGREGPHACVQAEVIDRYVHDVLIETLSRPDAAQAFARKGSGADVVKLRAEAKQNSTGLAQLAGDAAMGIIPRTIYLEAAARIKARLDEIGELIAEAGRQDAVALLVTADDIAAEWEAMDVTVKRTVISSLCSRVILKSPGCGCRNPDMGKVVSFRWRA